MLPPRVKDHSTSNVMVESDTLLVLLALLDLRGGNEERKMVKLYTSELLFSVCHLASITSYILSLKPGGSSSKNQWPLGCFSRYL